MSSRARRLRSNELPELAGKVIDEGGELRILRGTEHQLGLSIMVSSVVPGGGPRRHRHPHEEILVISDGSARFDVDGETLEAATGDMVVIPSETWHRFTNTGAARLRIVAVHDSERAMTQYEDGSGRD